MMVQKIIAYTAPAHRFQVPTDIRLALLRGQEDAQILGLSVTGTGENVTFVAVVLEPGDVPDTQAEDAAPETDA